VSLRPGLHSLLAATLIAASVGIGTWKVVEVRRENGRLALQAKTCMARNEAFLSVLRTANENRGARTPPEVAP
jgi:hypothetical protein